ncbi:hypothetical protein SEA_PHRAPPUCCINO_153 [Mycobacterium phage Phrappuccino]|uniref:Uncharacterized protein n=1 Tax=Mycobacterium phage Phrappuccino TaxID=2591223 RepID=A0A514DE03_9CAUD|nr:hypothetical protein KHQ87_gp153 [Mycobacterium phage Phrappuccino]QDH91828.1 hypothetical protein SEA_PHRAPPUCCINO_153 [Mycobacterium phage Phrappuccino]QIQ63270.1 hypothetical protein SEA_SETTECANDELA_153 [Mycobacterium phage Settecandela]
MGDTSTMGYRKITKFDDTSHLTPELQEAIRLLGLDKGDVIIVSGFEQRRQALTMAIDAYKDAVPAAALVNYADTFARYLADGLPVKDTEDAQDAPTPTGN